MDHREKRQRWTEKVGAAGGPSGEARQRSGKNFLEEPASKASVEERLDGVISRRDDFMKSHVGTRRQG